MDRSRLDSIVRATMPYARHPELVSDQDLANAGQLNPARLSADHNPNAALPPAHGTYKRLVKTDSGVREVDTGIKFTVAQWGPDGQPAAIKPLITTPEEKVNWDAFQDEAARLSLHPDIRIQRAEIQRVLDQEAHDSRRTAIKDSYKSEAEQDIEFEKRLLGETLAEGKFAGEVSERRGQYLAGQLGLELMTISLGMIDGEMTGAYVAMSPVGIMYGPAPLDALLRRLEIDVEERRRQAEKAAQMLAYKAELEAKTRITYFFNDREVTA